MKVYQHTGWDKFTWERGIRDSKLSPTDKYVALILGTYADRNGQCFPLIATIAAACGKSVSTVQRSLRKLEADKRVRVTDHPTMTGRYRPKLDTFLPPFRGS